MPFLYIWPILLLFKNFNNITSFFIKVHYFSLLLFLFFFVRLICQRGKFYIYMEHACSLPFVLRKNETKKKFLLFFLYCDMLLCKRFRQKFTIYFIMISDKKTVICTVQFWLTFFVLKSGKLGPKVLYFFTYYDIFVM